MGWRVPAGSSGQCCEGYVCDSVDAFFSSCVLAASVHKDLGPLAPQTAVTVKPLPEGQGAFDGLLDWSSHPLHMSKRTRNDQHLPLKQTPYQPTTTTKRCS